MKRILILVALGLFLCSTASPQGGGGESTKKKADTKKKSSGTKFVSLKPGYYFTVNMCRACLYNDWHSEAARMFLAKGIQALEGKGYENRTSLQPYTPINAFQMKFDSSGVSRPSDVLMQIDLYVGPFESEDAVDQAMDNISVVLAAIQKKRNDMEGANGGWPLNKGDRMRRSNGNNYEFGFFFIRGYKLLKEQRILFRG